MATMIRKVTLEWRLEWIRQALEKYDSCEISPKEFAERVRDILARRQDVSLAQRVGRAS